MQLRYHQPTYDLLTQTRIDPQKAIREYDARNPLEDVAAWAEIRHENLDERKKRYEQFRSKALAWTRRDLFQHPAAISEANVLKINAFEQVHHMKFPASVREWFSLDIAPDVMSANDLNLLEHMDIPEFQIPSVIDRLSTSDPRNDLWCFLIGEFLNQGGDIVYFQASQADDPPILIRSGNGFIEIARTFSEFLFLYFWDWLGRYHFEYQFHTVDVSGYLPRSLPEKYHVPLERLEKLYQRLPSTTTSRFYNEHVRIWVERPMDLNMNEARYDSVMRRCKVHADSLEALGSVISSLWPQELPLFYLLSWQAETKELLDGMRLSKIRKTLESASGWLTATELCTALDDSYTRLGIWVRGHLQELISQGIVESDPPSGDTPLNDRRFRLAR